MFRSSRVETTKQTLLQVYVSNLASHTGNRVTRTHGKYMCGRACGSGDAVQVNTMACRTSTHAWARAMRKHACPVLMNRCPGVTVVQCTSAHRHGPAYMHMWQVASWQATQELSTEYCAHARTRLLFHQHVLSCIEFVPLCSSSLNPACWLHVGYSC